MRALALVLGVVGCYRPASFDVDPCAITCSSDIGCPDGLTCTSGRCGTACDAPPVDTPDCAGGFGAGLVHICPPAPVENDNLDFDILMNHVHGSVESDATEICDFEIVQSAPGLPLCVVVANQITVSGYLRFHGANPVVLFAHERIVVVKGGQIDVSFSGAGADPADACTRQAGNQATMAGDAAGGGAGGSFASAGGNGGFGGAIAMAQPAIPLSELHYIRGGCDGGAGGANADGGTAGGPRGRGGGGLWLMSPGEIQIGGTVHANGSGGKGAPAGTGGGGAGAGGLIGIEAPRVHLSSTGIVVAHGGGGGGGSETTMGEDGDTAYFTGVPADAGDGSDVGLNGGDGSPNPQIGNGTGIAGSGGGGGGGGEGFIFILSQSPTIDGVTYPVFRTTAKR